VGEGHGGDGESGAGRGALKRRGRAIIISPDQLFDDSGTDYHGPKDPVKVMPWGIAALAETKDAKCLL
jgi:hypothetical protein